MIILFKLAVLVMANASALYGIAKAALAFYALAHSDEAQDAQGVEQ